MAETHRFVRGLAFCCCTLGMSCGPEGSQERAGELSPPARHAVHSRDLRTVMAGMEAQVRDVWPQEIAPLKEQQARRESKARFGEVAQAANRLANTAHSIPDAVPEPVLSGPDRQQFLRLVAELESRSRGLATAADRHNEVEMDAAMARVRATCRDCHSQFRDVAGRLRWGH